MKVTSLELTDIGGIPYLKLENINYQMNIICGENGVGKTNILDAISYCFSENDVDVLAKRVGVDQGNIQLKFKNDNIQDLVNINVSHSFPTTEYDHKYLNNNKFHSLKKSLLYLKVNRVFKYKKELSINADPDASNRERFNSAGVDNKDIKQWFISRHLHSAHEGNLSEVQQRNIELARRCFSLMNNEYSFRKTIPQNEIIVTTPTGEIYFEYLSSGFKSTLYILLGIIKELEYRFQDNHIAAESYDGLILIDEVELHLHPEWQGRICSVLKKVFPKVQFFITTHSPHVVQTASQDEVIALERKAGAVVKRDLPISEYGYQGWTVEEILEEVMGMPDLRTKKYNEYISLFEEALDSENKAQAQAAYDELNKMLHPDYPLRAVLKMQLNSLGE
jgi:predicted ATP-binding protein involved in virulence